MLMSRNTKKRWLLSRRSGNKRLVFNKIQYFKYIDCKIECQGKSGIALFVTQDGKTIREKLTVNIKEDIYKK